ncbi:DUF3035 domain-containing protein [Azospirillaceae bacterium]
MKEYSGLRPRRRRQPATGAVLGLALGAVVLSGCGDARKTFGLDRTPPDEFSVVAQAPLTLPPDFKLRPPRPGSARPQDVAPTEQAARAVFGSTGSTSKRASDKGQSGFAMIGKGEKELLQKAGADSAQQNIRAIVDQETTALISADRQWVDSLIFWQKQEQPYVVVDAQKEAQRLRDNAAQGKPVTAGDTPVIERKRKAPLEDVF